MWFQQVVQMTLIWGRGICVTNYCDIAKNGKKKKKDEKKKKPTKR